MKCHQRFVCACVSLCHFDFFDLLLLKSFLSLCHRFSKKKNLFLIDLSQFFFHRKIKINDWFNDLLTWFFLVFVFVEWKGMKNYTGCDFFGYTGFFLVNFVAVRRISFECFFPAICFVWPAKQTNRIFLKYIRLFPIFIF